MSDEGATPNCVRERAHRGRRCHDVRRGDFARLGGICMAGLRLTRGGRCAAVCNPEEVQKRMLDPALDALWPPIKLLWAWMVMQSDLVWHWIGALAHALIGLIGWLIDLFTDV